MRRVLAVLSLSAALLVVLGTIASAVAVPARYQLRGHLPELGERPTMRVFVTQAEYDSYRNSLGDADVFPPATSLFMSFDKDILALYTRGNDTGGRCIATAVTTDFSGGTLTATASWQSGTCGAPSTAHYPFILLAVSRTGSDGSSWLQSARSLCLTVETQDTNACANVGGGSASPSPSASASPSASPTSAASASPSPTATRSPTPSQTAAAASPTPTATAAPVSASPSRSPAAAASPSAAPTADDAGTNVLLYAMLIAIGFLVLLSLFLSRSGSGHRRR